ncbi:hypothetical protein [Winogradskyella sp.]|uniref:hypothetical protein n=1 Tax=Winogradskyella sp. TaxID=1883156 RepID=UPI003BACF447
MGIYKRTRQYILAFIICCLSCEEHEKGSLSNDEATTIRNLRQENRKLRNDKRIQQEVFENWFEAFSEVQEGFLSIDTKEVLRLEPWSEELEPYENDVIENLKNKASDIRKRITQLEDESKQLSFENDNLNSIISLYKQRLSYTESKIDVLEERNAILEEENDILNEENEDLNEGIESLSIDLSDKSNTIEGQKAIIESLKQKLNERYIVLVTTKQTRIYRTQSREIDLDYDAKKIEILTTHPRGSYKMLKTYSGSSLQIRNESSFWSKANILVIRIKQRKF